ncbi:DTW domain-containing protein [Pseudomonas songnenensis]|uniref:tRNA-uridine aminocarboxypropyltransferase n=1 Tax=Pseudomonas songnenensis TaxID=1176259 RepID=A0ABX9UZB1_9PSED|nr:DTW domain-containing protein [Pseudomonas songnenensis]MCQ4299630.1 DTW domain-containing protein [Pseudomonas songnenensis]RMH98329.1 DTW domain-containing protein [Pseudomonas songnenensis]
MSRPRCSRCQRPLSLCLCALIPSLDSRTQVLVLQHASEASHALNTARLAVLGLRNAQLRVGENFTDESSGDVPSYLLFPGEEAVPLSTLAGADRPIRLIVPDGTWRKARKILHINPWLAALPRVALPEGLASRYRLRKAPMPGALSTIEAIVTALNILERPAEFDELLRPFDALIEGQIDAMGALTYQRNHAGGA